MNTLSFQVIGTTVALVPLAAFGFVRYLRRSTDSEAKTTDRSSMTELATNEGAAAEALPEGSSLAISVRQAKVRMAEAKYKADLGLAFAMFHADITLAQAQSSSPPQPERQEEAQPTDRGGVEVQTRGTPISRRPPVESLGPPRASMSVVEIANAILDASQAEQEAIFREVARIAAERRLEGKAIFVGGNYPVAAYDSEGHSSDVYDFEVEEVEVSEPAQESPWTRPPG